MNSWSMNVVIINKSDARGGAAVVSYRLLEAFVEEGINARMLVAEKLTDNPRVALAASPSRLKASFMTERLDIFMKNGFNRATLFQIDTAHCGINLAEHQWVKEADMICLNWINQGLLSLRDIEKIGKLNIPLIWTMHDMWNMTGICHHVGECLRYRENCGECPLLGNKAGPRDMSAVVLQRKKSLYSEIPIQFVAVSNWLARKARTSTLLSGQELTVIPNAFPIENSTVTNLSERDSKIRLVFGAARLDDPVKGFNILIRVTEILAGHFPELARNMELLTFGNIRNPELLEKLQIPHHHHGPLPKEKVKEVYQKGNIVISTSLYETLPGTLVEGMAWGAVPVSLNRGGQSDIIDHRITGYLAEWPDDGSRERAARNIVDGIVWAAEAIKTNGAAMRERMYNSVKSRFAASSVVRAYMYLYAKIMGKRNRE